MTNMHDSSKAFVKKKRIKYCSEVHVAIDRYLKEKLHAVQS